MLEPQKGLRVRVPKINFRSFAPPKKVRSCLDSPFDMLQFRVSTSFVSIMDRENGHFYDFVVPEFFITPPPPNHDIMSCEQPSPLFLTIWY